MRAPNDSPRLLVGWPGPVIRIVTAALLVTASTVAQDSPSADKDPAGVAVLSELASRLNADGSRLQSVRLEGRLLLVSAEKTDPLPFVALADRSGRIRWEFEGPSSPSLRVVDGAFGWEQHGEEVRTLGLSRTSGAGLEVVPVLVLSDWIESSQQRVVALEQESSAERVLDRVQISRFVAQERDNEYGVALERVTRREVVVDREAGRIRALRYNRHPGDWRIDIPEEAQFFDYKDLDGTLWPTRVRIVRAGTTQLEFLFESVALNVPIDDRVFARPQP